MLAKPCSESRQIYFHSWSSVAMRYAKRLHTSTRRANKATSATAQHSRIWARISGGMLAMGQGGGGDSSVGGGAGGIESEENKAMRSVVADEGGPSREG